MRIKVQRNHESGMSATRHAGMALAKFFLQQAQGGRIKVVLCRFPIAKMRGQINMRVIFGRIQGGKYMTGRDIFVDACRDTVQQCWKKGLKLEVWHSKVSHIKVGWV